jgi:hypothetical protein
VFHDHVLECHRDFRKTRKYGELWCLVCHARTDSSSISSDKCGWWCISYFTCFACSWLCTLWWPTSWSGSTTHHWCSMTTVLWTLALT